MLDLPPTQLSLNSKVGRLPLCAIRKLLNPDLPLRNGKALVRRPLIRPVNGTLLLVQQQAAKLAVEALSVAELQRRSTNKLVPPIPSTLV